jgi:hypothetical protein
MFEINSLNDKARLKAVSNGVAAVPSNATYSRWDDRQRKDEELARSMGLSLSYTDTVTHNARMWR